MHIGALTLELYLPGCASLKQKRSRVRSLVARLHREFNVSSAEVDLNDMHQSALIACVVVSNDHGRTQKLLGRIPGWIEKHRPDLQIIDHTIELI